MRAQMKLLCLLVCLLVWAVPRALGQVKETTKAGCENANSQLEMNQCWAAAWKAADTELNTLYASVQSKRKADNAVSEKLRIAQRVWIRYRDANCEAAAEIYTGGSIQPMIRAECMERVTRARIVELHTIYDEP